MNRITGWTLGVAVALATLPAAASAQHQHHGAGAQGDSAAVAAVVHGFHDALQKADTAAVRRLLADHVRILESGNVEDRGHYMSGHMAGDMAFAQAVPSHPEHMEIFVRGDVAWAVSTSVRQGKYRDRDIDSQGAELMILERMGGEWRVAAVHWSSRNRR